MDKKNTRRAYDGKRRKALPNPPPRKLNRVTRRLEDATRRFLNYLSYCMSARTRDMLEYQDWKYETSDELCALCAHYNTIHDNRKNKEKEVRCGQHSL